MQVQDSRYDDSFNYIWYQDSGPWSTRFTIWYVPGLLHRAQGQDIENGIASIESVSVMWILSCKQMTLTKYLQAGHSDE